MTTEKEDGLLRAAEISEGRLKNLEKALDITLKELRHAVRFWDQLNLHDAARYIDTMNKVAEFTKVSSSNTPKTVKHAVDCLAGVVGGDCSCGAEAADLHEQLQGFKDGAEEDEAHILEQDALIKDLRERLAKVEALAKQRNAVSELLMDKPTELLDIMMNAHDAHSFWAEIDALAHPKGEDHGNG